MNEQEIKHISHYIDCKIKESISGFTKEDVVSKLAAKDALIIQQRKEIAELKD